VARPRTAAATAEAASTATLAKLTERFAVEDHKKNPRGYTYIAIEKVIGRWNEVLGPKWNLDIESLKFELTPGVTFGNRNPKPGAVALVCVSIRAEIDGETVIRGGVGADFGAADDADKLVKTALAEAIKKASNEFGIGLYLWDEEERALIDSAAQQGMTGVVQAAPVAGAADVSAAPVAPIAPLVPVDSAEVQELKNKVADLAVLHGIQRTGPAIAAHFGITIEQLQDEAMLRAILEANQPVTA
jgi:hypothetical protein